MTVRKKAHPDSMCTPNNSNQKNNNKKNTMSTQ